MPTTGNDDAGMGSNALLLSFDKLKESDVRSRSSSRSMISDAVSEAATSERDGQRLDLGSSGAFLLAQSRAREAAGDSSAKNTDGSGSTGDFQIIDDYFDDGLAPGSDFDAIEQSMLAALVQEDEVAVRSAPRRARGAASPPRPRKEKVAKKKLPVPPNRPSGTSSTWSAGIRSPDAPHKKATPGQAGAVPAAFGTPAEKVGGGAQMMGFGGGGGGSSGNSFPTAANASWSAGMGNQHYQQFQQMTVYQMQHAAATAALKRTEMMPGPGMGQTHRRSWSGPFGHNSGAAAYSPGMGLSGRVDALQRVGVITATQRGLVQTILDRGDPFLTAQFVGGIAAAERGQPQRLQELCRMAETLQASMPQQQQHDPSPPYAALPHAAAARTTARDAGDRGHSTVPFPGAELSTTTSGASTKATPAYFSKGSIEDELELSAAASALDLGERTALEASAAALTAMTQKRRSRAVDLRDANRFEEALLEMKALKKSEAILGDLRRALAGLP